MTTASAGKHDAIAYLADEVIDYRAPNYGEQLKQTAGDGFDAVVDFTNHASFNRSFDLLKKGGVLIATGIQTLSKQFEKKPPVHLLSSHSILCACSQHSPYGTSYPMANAQAFSASSLASRNSRYAIKMT